MRFIHLFVGILCAVVFGACSSNPATTTFTETAEPKGMPSVFVGVLYDQFWHFDGLLSEDSFNLSDTFTETEDSNVYMQLLCLPEGKQQLRFVSYFGDTIIYDCLPSTDTLTTIAPGKNYYQVYEHYPITFEQVITVDTFPQPNLREALKQFGSITIGMVSSGCFHHYESYRTYTLHGDYLMEHTNIVSGSAISAVESANGGDDIKTVVLPASYLDTLQLVQQKLFDHAEASNIPKYEDLGNGIMSVSGIVFSTNRYCYTFCLGRDVHRVYTHRHFPYAFDYREHNVQTKLVDGWESLNSN